jgi:hypothetical protein
MNPTRRRICVSALGLGLVGVSLAASAPEQRQEAWDAVFRGDAKIGHIHTYIEPVTDKQRKLLRVRVDTVLNFRRNNNEVTIKLRYGTIETPEGSVLRLDHRTLASQDEMRTHGDVVGDEMVLTLEGSGQSERRKIPWGPDVRGPYAPEQSLARKPIKAGESRQLKMYIPDLNEVCEITLTAKGREEVPLGDRSKRALLRVEQTTTLRGKPKPELDTTLWVDENGQVMKSYQDIMGGLAVYRTTKEGANAPDTGMREDSILASVIKVTHKIAQSTTQHHVLYRVTHTQEDPARILPADRRQTIEPGPDQKTSKLVVKTAGPEDGESGPELVDEKYLRPNALVTSEDSLIRVLAREAVGKETDPWKKAVRIENWVFKNIKDKNFATTFAPASEVARNLSGDCTEHSVLAAAMCRAVGIPARVVVGLIYVDHLGGFGFHMWHEVYVNRRWVALDSSFDQSSVDATHIKLDDTSLDGVAPFESFLPVVRVMGKMTIEPVETR